MQKLFENWRKYLIEADDPDSDVDDAAELRDIANDLEPEVSDEEKIFNAFLDNGAHGLHLAEMTGSPIAKDLGSIVQGIRNYISLIEDPPEFNLKSTGGLHDHAWIIHRRLEKESTSISSEILDILIATNAFGIDLTDEFDTAYDAHSDRHSWHAEFEEMLTEAGDYVWWHGKYANKSPSLNIASKERSTVLLNDLKEWAGA